MVSILILMDVPLQPVRCKCHLYDALYVSILVLMDVPLQLAGRSPKTINLSKFQSLF